MGSASHRCIRQRRRNRRSSMPQMALAASGRKSSVGITKRPRPSPAGKREKPHGPAARQRRPPMAKAKVEEAIAEIEDTGVDISEAEELAGIKTKPDKEPEVEGGG